MNAQVLYVGTKYYDYYEWEGRPPLAQRLPAKIRSKRMELMISVYTPDNEGKSDFMRRQPALGLKKE
jgi:hypothetical protein